MLKGLDERAASIYAPIQPQLRQVEERLGNLPDQSPDYLRPLMDHVLTSGGKRIRPAITLLAAEFYPHKPENPLIMAGAVELLHLATLIHDDTVDNADMRRGRPTVSNLWDKHVAVVFGDYLFATSATFVLRLRYQERPGHTPVLRDHHGTGQRRAGRIFQHL
ncbi:MAG: polyprenyl synthetase family protein [Chloroflexi bacterium]|nr:polyprenyl synthetase family protein [Chloroflexota bacterium]